MWIKETILIIIIIIIIIIVASAHNFADDNTLSSFAKTIENLISILESESEIAINWFKDNHMIVNPGKFQAIIFGKHKGNLILTKL